MKLVVQFLIILIFVNTFNAAEQKKLLAEILNGTGTSYDSYTEKLTDNNDFNEKAKSDWESKERNEFSSNFANPASNQTMEESPILFQNINLTTSDLGRIILRDRTKIVNRQEKRKDAKTDLKAGEKSEAYNELLSYPVTIEKFNQTSSISNYEQNRSHNLMPNTTQDVSSIDNQQVLVSPTVQLIIKENLDLLTKEEEKKADSSSSFNQSFNFQLIENKTEKQEDSKNTVYQSLQPIEQTNKYEISNLLPNSKENIIVIKKQKDNTDILNNWQHFWTENPAEIINLYQITHKSLNNTENTQNSNLPQKELIQIVLKETNSNSNKTQIANSLSSKEVTNAQDEQFKKDSSILGQSAAIQKAGKEEQASNNKNNVTLDFLDIRGLQVHGNKQNETMEEVIVSSKDSRADLDTKPKENSKLLWQHLNNFKGPNSFSLKENELERVAFSEVTKLEETKDLIHTAAVEEINSSQVTYEESNTTACNSFKEAENASVKANEVKEKAFNKTVEEKDLMPKNSLAESVAAAGKLTNSLPKVNETQTELREINLKTPKEKTLNIFKIETKTVLEKANLKEDNNLNKSKEIKNLNSLDSLDKSNSMLFAANKTLFEDVPNVKEMKKEKVLDPIESLVNTPVSATKTDLKPLHNFETFQNITENELEKARKAINLKENIKGRETLMTLNSFGEDHILNTTDNEMQDFKKNSDFNLEQKVTDSKALSASSSTNTEAVREIKSELPNKFKEPQNYTANEEIGTIKENEEDYGLLAKENKQYYPESDFSSSSEEASDEVEPHSTTKSLITLEEYAVKQMNFILDYLLLETQTFVAKVLQATINSVFPRDRLKLYAEGVNQVLGPVTSSDYSDEIFESNKTTSHDELYEQIVKKLNFLKRKPSKYLQQQIPPEWLQEFHERRLELVIWLDKASEQMHKEFTGYITEAEDPLKYQYFNETFDDISRATEIHHKLALLADLVKIIKNKKQITFMDLYMQN